MSGGYVATFPIPIVPQLDSGLLREVVLRRIALGASDPAAQECSDFTAGSRGVITWRRMIQKRQPTE